MVLFAVLSAVNRTFSETINEEVVLDFEQLQGFFQLQQSLRYDRLVESAYLISLNATFQANVQLRDPATVAYAVEEEYSLFIKSDLFVVTDDKGQVLSWMGIPDSTDTDITHRQTIANAIEGVEPPIDIEWPELWAVDDELYQVVTIPIYKDDFVIGTITLGTVFTNQNAEQLRENTPLEVVMFVDDRAIAYSDDRMMLSDYSTLTEELKTEVDIIFGMDSVQVTDPFRTTISDDEVLAFISPLGFGERAYYVAYVPLSIQLAFLSDIQRDIFVIAILSILVLIPVSYLVARAFSGPIKSLTNAMLKVREGDLDVSVQARTRDEIGILTRTFNEMIQGLRERFALSKYVGDHTLSMIQKSKDKDLKIGGTVEKLAILFTDIRGSTKMIERASAEDFVSMLNQTLSDQADAVLANNGSIDKFVGDSIIALFSGPDSIQRCVQAAVDIQKTYCGNTAVSSFFDGLGIGVNYGPVILGNMGANQRMDYTVIGQHVNLCARLCSKAASGQILLTSTLVNAYRLRDHFEFSSVGKHELKGFSTKMDLVEVSYER